jgi:hypothetical protein
MSASLLSTFERYQQARVAFVQAVAEAATRPANVDVMQNAGVMQLLRPLLLDNVPSIQQTAALALGRLANCSDDLAEAVVQNDILPQLVYSLGEQNRFYKKAAAFVLRAVAKHSPELAQAVVDVGALEALVLCLEEFEDYGNNEAKSVAVRKVQELLRDLISESPVNWSIGTTSGESRTYHLRMPLMASSIRPLRDAASLSRFIQFELVKDDRRGDPVIAVLDKFGAPLA